jgi:PadR family transcriptional regulator PadR
MIDLTAFQRDCLYIITGRDRPHGLAIADDLEAYYDTEIQPGRLYPNLDSLVEKGLVNKGQQDRRTNWYGLTQRGEREIEDRHDWEKQTLDRSPDG